MKGWPRRFCEAAAPAILLVLMLLTPIVALYLCGGIEATFWGFIIAGIVSVFAEIGYIWTLNEYFLDKDDDD